jgi:hypothetical protein
MKRVTVHVFNSGQFADANSVRKFLEGHGVNAVVVTKHAVQVRPDQQVLAAEVLPKYTWGWDRKAEKKGGSENAEG